jgi:hypothetical protein
MRFSIDTCHTLQQRPEVIQRTNAMEILWRADEALGELATTVEVIKLRWSYAHKSGLQAIFDGFLKMDDSKFQFQIQSDCLGDPQSTVDSITGAVRHIISDHMQQTHKKARHWRALLAEKEAGTK